jgi:hypothetical protein
VFEEDIYASGMIPCGICFGGGEGGIKGENLFLMAEPTYVRTPFNCVPALCKFM